MRQPSQHRPTYPTLRQALLGSLGAASLSLTGCGEETAQSRVQTVEGQSVEQVQSRQLPQGMPPVPAATSVEPAHPVSVALGEMPMVQQPTQQQPGTKGSEVHCLSPEVVPGAVQEPGTVEPQQQRFMGKQIDPEPEKPVAEPELRMADGDLVVPDTRMIAGVIAIPDEPVITELDLPVEEIETGDEVVEPDLPRGNM